MIVPTTVDSVDAWMREHCDQGHKVQTQMLGGAICFTCRKAVQPDRSDPHEWD